LSYKAQFVGDSHLRWHAGASVTPCGRSHRPEAVCLRENNMLSLILDTPAKSILQEWQRNRVDASRSLTEKRKTL